LGVPGLQGFPLLREQAGVGDGHGQQVGHNPQGGDVVGMEGVGLFALYIQDAQDVLTHLQGKGHFRTGLGELGVGIVEGVFRHILHHPNLPRVGHETHDTLFAHPQAEAPLNQALAALGAGRPHHRPLTGLIQKEDTHLIESEPLGQQIRGFLQDGVQIPFHGDDTADVRGGMGLGHPALEGVSALLNLLLQETPRLVHLFRHGVEDPGQQTHFVRTFLRKAELPVALGIMATSAKDPGMSKR